MATKKISELEAITEADDSDVLAIVDVSEGKTNKITKNNLLIGAGHSIEMSLNQETYALTLTLKNAAGTELSTASIDLPNENSITDISYNNGKLTLTKQSGTTTKVDITGLINGLVTENALNNLANALKQTIGIQTNTYDNTKTYNTGDIVVQNEKIYKANQDEITGTFDSSKWDEISLYEYQKIQDEAIEENYKVITKLQEENEDLKKNQLTNTPEKATSHYLQDSADSRFRKFIPIGRTTQESTTGKQLFDWSKITNVSRDISNGTLNENLENGIICKGNTSSSEDEGANSKGWFTPGNVNTNARINITEVSNITMSADITLLESGGFANVIRFYLGNGSTTKTSASKSLTLNQKIRLSQTFSNIPAGNWFLIFTLASNKIRIENIMISTSTDINYEPYTGGEPAPNPNYPYAIKNTGDNVNIFNKDNPHIYSSGLTKIEPNDNGVDFITNTMGGFALFDLGEITQYKNKTLTLSLDNTSLNFNNSAFMNCSSTGENRTVIGSEIGNNNSVSVKIGENYSQTNLAVRLYLRNATAGQTYSINNIKIEQGTVATPYSPYGCGNVNEKVTNANIWDEEWELGGINNSNGENYVSTSLIRSKNYIPVNPNTQLYIKNGTDYAWFYAYDKDKNFIGYAFGSSTSVANEIKTTIANCYYVRFQCRSQYGTTYNNDICINVSNPSINGTYVPHSEQTLSFPLAQGQKFYEGSYPDDDEKVHHKMGEMVLPPINSLTSGTVFGVSCKFGAINIPTMKSQSSVSGNFFCDKVKYANGVWGKYQGYVIAKNFVVLTDLEDTVENFNSKISGATLQFPLEQETTEDFTEEQKTAWEQIKKARTYKNVTHISSEDETPANVEIEYVQDTKTYIDNQIEPLKSAIISLGGNV